MKNIYNSLLFALIAAMPFLTSCKDDNDSNPTLSIPSSFVLNTRDWQPAMSMTSLMERST